MPDGSKQQKEREEIQSEITRLQECLGSVQEAFSSLERSHERYRALVEATSQMVWSVNIRGNWGQEVDAWWEEVTGQSMEEAAGWGWLEAVHPEDREQARLRWLHALENPANYRHEYRLRTRSGEYRWYASYGVPIRNPDGSVREWIGMFTDIHSRRVVEEELKVLERAVMTSPVGVAFSDMEGCLTKVNPAFLRLLGYDDEDQMKGRYIFEFSADPSKWPQTREAILSNGYWEGERVVVHKNGSYITIEVFASCVKDAQGKTVGMMGTFIDLTEKKRLSEQLYNAQKLEGIGRLAGGVAHDFNNLLTAILGFAEIAQESLPEDAPQQKDIANIHKAAQRAADLTRQLLAFARKQTVEPKVVSINDIITDDLVILRRLIGEDIKFNTSLEPTSWKVKMDPGQITQILVNLIVNARDAMPDGGSLTITTTNRRVDNTDSSWFTKDTAADYILIVVSDTGTGITEEDQVHLFEPFFTTKEQGKGTGLGLATTYGIVKQNGGYIQVDSTLGEGTTFSIYLPRNTETVETTVLQKKNLPISVQDKTILIVEDDPLVRDVSARILHTLDYTVMEAANGVEALQLLQEHSGQIDLVMTDTVMPRMSGSTLIQELRLTYPTLKILLMSGYSEHPALSATQEADAFLQKPFTPASLAQKLREAMAEDAR